MEPRCVNINAQYHWLWWGRQSIRDIIILFPRCKKYDLACLSKLCPKSWKVQNYWNDLRLNLNKKQRF